MTDRTFAAALTNATYEFLGNQHQSLLQEARREVPHAHGATLATAVLGLLQPDISRDAQRQGDAFYTRWLNRHGGERPRIRTRERVGALLRTEDETMETEDLRWVGLAVLVAVAGGALVWLLARTRAEAAAPPVVPPVPVPGPKQKPVRYALAAFSGKVREAGASPATAGDLLAQAAFWWVGAADAWDEIARTAGLSVANVMPETDDALLVLVYEAPGAFNGTPSSRPEGAAWLREAARAGELRVIGTFSLRDATQLSAAGFRR